jgi:hypothetical protein
MNETTSDAGMRALDVRLARLEEREVGRDDRMARMETTLSKLDQQIDTMTEDIRAAKTGLRIGLWISSTLAPALAGIAGWFAHQLTGR